MNYYYLIAGLPDIEIEDNKLTFTISGFKEEVHTQLSFDDARLMELFFTKFDNQNLLRFLKNKEAHFDERGNMNREELAEGLMLISENDDPKNRFFPPYFKVFVEEYYDVQQADTEMIKWENRLTELYFQWAMNCSNDLVKRWFEFNLNLNNLLSAYASRKHQVHVEVVGDNEIAESIRTSSQRDFGLTGTIDDLDVFQRLAEEPDLFEREKKIDLFKWQWLEEQTVFNFFGIERIFAYLVQLEIIERWVSLNPEQGEKIFRELINALKENVVNQKSKTEIKK